MVSTKQNGSPPAAALPGSTTLSSLQRNMTLEMPFLPSSASGALFMGGSGPGEGSSYYAHSCAGSIHGEAVRASGNCLPSPITVGGRCRDRRLPLGTIGEEGKGRRALQKAERIPICDERCGQTISFAVDVVVVPVFFSLTLFSHLFFKRHHHHNKNSLYHTRPPAAAPSPSSCSSLLWETSSASSASSTCGNSRYF